MSTPICTGFTLRDTKLNFVLGVTSSKRYVPLRMYFVSTKCIIGPERMSVFVSRDKKMEDNPAELKIYTHKISGCQEVV